MEERLKMFNLFKKKYKKDMEKSVEKYSQVLRDDINLIIKTTYNSKSYTSYVEDFNNREVVFRCPIDENEIIRFKVESIIKVEFISYSGIYKTELFVTEKIMENDNLEYKGKISAPMKRNERRKYYRLPVVLELSYKTSPRENKTYSGRTF